MKRPYKKYILLVFYALITLFTSCINKREDNRQSIEVLKDHDCYDDEKDQPDIRR